MQDKYRKKYRLSAASGRLRQQIALEAARRIIKTLIPAGDEPPADWLEAAGPSDLYAAKRKAAAVLGHRIRPGDLPSDAEVRDQLIALRRDPGHASADADDLPEPEPGALVASPDLYAMRDLIFAAHDMTHDDQTVEAAELLREAAAIARSWS